MVKKINRNKQKAINIRVTESQYKFIRKMADDNAISMTEWFELACAKMIDKTLVEWRKL
jgi:uncharacterized protein (DUF1778 family)